MKTVHATGSRGLIGWKQRGHFDCQGHAVHGLDNNKRLVFFGDLGDTTLKLDRLR